MKTVRARVVVTGLVQGVFFRAKTADTALTHDVCGWVRNNPDGTVEAVFEGREEDVKKVLDWCHTGPPEAKVEKIDVTSEDPGGEFKDFNINYS